MFYGLVRPCFEALDELLGVVNGYRELLNKLRRRLRSRAKMGEKRYRSRFRKLPYKLSRTRSLDEFIGGGRLDPFKRAITMFNSWLRRRKYKLLHELNPNRL